MSDDYWTRDEDKDFVHLEGVPFSVVGREGKLFLIANDPFYWSEIQTCPFCGFHFYVSTKATCQQLREGKVRVTDNGEVQIL